MQMFQSVFLQPRIVFSLFCFIGAVFLANPARADAPGKGDPKVGLRVAGYPANQASGPAIASVVTKGAGEALVTITGVALKSSLSYCLIGVGRGNWYGTATKVQLEKIGCAKAEGGKVIVPIRLEAKRYEANGAIIGYVPIVTDASGAIIDWPQKPVGSQEFERTNGTKDRVIPIVWSTAGIAQLATAEQAMTIND